MVTYMEANQKLKPIPAVLFMRVKKREEKKIISLTRKELQQATLNHPSNIQFKDFMKLYQNYTK